MIKVYVYGAAEPEPAPIVTKCMALILSTGKYQVVPEPTGADLAVAPLLTRFLSLTEIYEPKIGTLVFHPSLLPRHRGADAIKWAYKLGESYTGATWFWPDEGIDTGDICEQEVLAIPPGDGPRVFYENKVVPAAVGMLARILSDIDRGVIRRIPQKEDNASYEPPLKRG